MEMFGIIKFTCSYDEWKSIYIKKGDVETNFNLKPLQFKASL